MKKRITENQLKDIVLESVKKVLKEGKTYSPEVQEALVTISKAANLIANATQGTREEDYEPNLEQGYNDDFFLNEWATKLSQETEQWLNA